MGDNEDGGVVGALNSHKNIVLSCSINIAVYILVFMFGGLLSMIFDNRSIIEVKSFATDKHVYKVGDAMTISREFVKKRNCVITSSSAFLEEQGGKKKYPIGLEGGAIIFNTNVGEETSYKVRTRIPQDVPAGVYYPVFTTSHICYGFVGRSEKSRARKIRILR